MPRGGVVDIAEIRDGRIGPDRASLLDFLPDGWSKWINANPLIEYFGKKTFFTEIAPAGRVNLSLTPGAHFNSYPLDMDKEIGIDPGTATVQEIFREARRMGGDVIQINHPYLTYGYFHTHETGEIPGGYSDAFDLVEITAGDLKANSATIERTWRLWNQGRRAYLSAGSDVHDVWLNVSGAARMYVKVEGELTVERFIAALKRGNAYATTGPLVYPEQMFGGEILHARGTPLSLDYSIQAINGQVSVKLIEQGQQIQSQSSDNTDDLSRVGFVVTPQADTWYSLVVEDANGKYLFSNPVWVRIRDGTGPASDP